MSILKVQARTKNAILKRIDSIVRKHGRAETYAILQRWCSRERDRNRLAWEAADLKRQLAEVERRRS